MSLVRITVSLVPLGKIHHMHFLTSLLCTGMPKVHLFPFFFVVSKVYLIDNVFINLYGENGFKLSICGIMHRRVNFQAFL